MNNMRPPRKKNINWEHNMLDSQQINQNQDFQLYILARPDKFLFYGFIINLKRIDNFKNISINQKNQINIKGYPYVDNMLTQIDKFNRNFKIICQINDLDRIFQFHRENKKLLSIYIFDLDLKTKSIKSKSKKIQMKTDDFYSLKNNILRKRFQKNQTQIFTNATRITGSDISEVNSSRLVLKTLLVSKDDKKGKQDFIKLASVVTQQHGQITEYQSKYQLNSSPEEAIKWYTKQNFYHKLVNNALKAGRGNPLFLAYIRFPVKQLYNSIKSRYNNKKLYQQSFQCYRGGTINQNQLQYFRKNKNGFIQMQGFLSCSKSKQEIKQFIVNCVFVIKIKNLQRDYEWDHGFCFLDTEQLTQYVKQQEVLFNIFTVMQIKDVTKQFYNNTQVDVITLQYGSLANLLYLKKNNLQIQSYQKKCIISYQALKPNYDSITNQGDCFKFFDQYKLAEQYFLKKLGHYQKHKNQDKKTLFGIYLNLGSIQMGLSEFNKSKQMYLKAKQILQNKLQKLQVDKFNQASVYNGLGLAYKKLNKLVESKQNYLKTVQIIQLSRNQTIRKLLSTVYNNLAGIFMEQFQEKQALEYYSKALNIIQNQNNGTVANTYYNIGIVYLQKNEYRQAIKNLSKSLQISIQILGNVKDTANSHFKLGQAYLKNNEINLSNRHFDSALQIMRSLTDPHNQKYIKMKRQIQDLKTTRKRITQRGSSSLDSHKMPDIFSFLNNNEQVTKILKQPKNKFKTQTDILGLKLGLGQVDNGNSNFGHSRQNSQQKFRYLRAQNIVGGQNNNYTKNNSPNSINNSPNTIQTLQTKIELKLTQFNTNDFINNLQTNRQKRKIISLY